MKDSKTFVCVAMTLALSTAIAAQAPQSPQGAPSSSQDRNANTTVTLIGCVESSAPTTFVLNVVEQPVASTAANRPAAEATAVGTAGATLVGQRVQLSATDDAGLKTHVGHKVEIRGALAPPAPASATGSSSTTAPASPMMRFTVNNVRMLDATCAPAGAAGASGAAPAPRPATPAQPPPPQQPQSEPQPRQER